MGWFRRLQADRLLVLVYWDACLNWDGHNASRKIPEDYLGGDA